jgi:hypothetical protein
VPSCRLTDSCQTVGLRGAPRQHPAAISTKSIPLPPFGKGVHPGCIDLGPDGSRPCIFTIVVRQKQQDKRFVHGSSGLGHRGGISSMC